MKHHAAFGLAMEDIDAVVVEDSKPMQTILRSILLSFKVARVRVFDSVDDALEASLAEPPNVILTDWRMEPTSGYQFLRLVRHRHMEPLCYVPILFVTAHGTRPLVDKALRAGAHHVLVKPLSPSTLYKRLRWLMTDDRPMILENSGFYNIYGIQRSMDEQAEKMQSLAGARLHHKIAVQKRAEVDSVVEEEFDNSKKQQPVFAGVKKGGVKKNSDEAPAEKKQHSAASKHIRNADYVKSKDLKLH
ncbi:response regulator [Roseibium sp. MMSF_3544]|uniref:response regulator n=1 Tax=unclassified Roseibium TaxID=2629323 RepID=UPI00273F3F76|nr:response regulator [Roseibium sp. MMSF_3544]